MKKKGHTLSCFYGVDHRKTNLVCVCSSTILLFKTAILRDIHNIWLSWQLNKVNVIVKWGKSISLCYVYNIDHSKSNLLHINRSTSFVKTAILSNALIWLPWQRFSFNWHCTTHPNITLIYKRYWRSYFLFYYWLLL